jgi:transposase
MYSEGFSGNIQKKHVVMNNSVSISPSNFKLKTSVRNQYEFHSLCLDQLIPEDHKGRHVWDFVSDMDLSACFIDIITYHNEPGRSKIDPKILLTLWIYSILDGNSSARKLEELCLNHDVYKWICGGVAVSRTSLAEFRSVNPRKFDELLTKCLAVMVKNGLLFDSDFSQDGTRVKANAGNNSFRSEDSLKELEAKTTKYLDELKIEEKTSIDAYEKRKLKEKSRKAAEKKNRIKSALENLEEARCEKVINGIRNHNKPTEEDIKNIRASTTDPEVRRMKMGDSGYRLAYNVQFATGLDSRVIYGVDIVKTLDPGTPPRLMNQVQERLKNLNIVGGIKNWIADSAYSAKNDIITIANLFPGCFYYAPAKPQKGIDPKVHLKNDCDALKAWRDSINSDHVQYIYKKRCSTAEFSNMHVKNQALKEFSVRGLVKVKGMAILHAIAQNISRSFDLLKKNRKF